MMSEFSINLRVWEPRCLQGLHQHAAILNLPAQAIHTSSRLPTLTYNCSTQHCPIVFKAKGWCKVTYLSVVEWRLKVECLDRRCILLVWDQRVELLEVRVGSHPQMVCTQITPLPHHPHCSLHSMRENCRLEFI